MPIASVDSETSMQSGRACCRAAGGGPAAHSAATASSVAIALAVAPDTVANGAAPGRPVCPAAAAAAPKRLVEHWSGGSSAELVSSLAPRAEPAPTAPVLRAPRAEATALASEASAAASDDTSGASPAIQRRIDLPTCSGVSDTFDCEHIATTDMPADTSACPADTCSCDVVQCRWSLRPADDSRLPKPLDTADQSLGWESDAGPSALVRRPSSPKSAETAAGVTPEAAVSRALRNPE
mmetsp:Transcript_14900/g.56095  ORF Transcript_14900/g.56095 Transcript_14900/m.56095 type:complete len:238 (+) Transcript_14900:187-900(+)